MALNAPERLSMESKFKVGDRVKVREHTFISKTFQRYNGVIGTIVRIDQGYMGGFSNTIQLDGDVEQPPFPFPCHLLTLAENGIERARKIINGE